MYPHDGQTVQNSLVLFFITLLLTGLGLPPSVYAQKGKPLQLEFPASQYGDNIQHIACDTDGVCICYIAATDSNVFHLIHYNRDFQLQSHIQYLIPSESAIEAFSYGEHEIVLILQQRIKKKRAEKGLLIRYNCQRFQADTLSLTGLPSSGIFRIRNCNALTVFSNVSANNKTSNLYFLLRGDQKALELTIPDAIDYRIETFEIDTALGHVLIGLNSSINNKTLIWFCETDYDRNVLFLAELPDTLQFRCESMRIAPLDSSHWLMAGTYSNRANDVVMGAYSLPYHNFRFDSLRHHQYSPASMAASNNTPYYHNGGRIVRNGHQVAFITENFYPEYHDRPVYNYGVMTYEYSFHGYRYTSADVFLFDFTGEETWYYNFPYDNILSQQVGTYLNLAFVQDNILLYYTRGNEMVTMLTNTQDVILDSKREQNIFPDNNYSSYAYDQTAIRSWFGDYYLLSGHKSSTKSSHTGSIFFLRKLWYR